MAVSQQQRQKQLFAAEDWQVIYTAFTQVNFNAYDFPTIRNAMVEYIRLNYPEDFNDWIESSEFVAIIDLLAYLGQSIAFRMDLNTRENFLDTAQRRDSIFRLARMLSYQPQRSIPSAGLLKVSQVVTNQEVYDANGLNLSNTPINWNDQNNPDWQEQFILVLNASLNNTNYFGNPAKSGVVNNIPTDLYALNNTAIPTSSIGFTSTVGGNSMNFELANPDFNGASGGNATVLGTSGYFFERTPNPVNSWYIIYQNDGNGYGSANTGFFLFFKQGNMGYADYLLDLAIANRVIDVNVSGINQTDVWVQNVNTVGLVTADWTAVPSVNGFNVIYNSLEKNIRNIYSVITRDFNGADQISIRFADGNFGNVPVGLIRVWYRISNGLQYQIRPTDMSNLKFNFAYNDNLFNTYSIAFNTSLQYTVANSQATQTNQQIALAAEQVYYTQDRMVNGEDYNLFPLQSSLALKVKAVNRTYSGQSRYIDINDPTGTYQNLNVFATDGILYEESELNAQEIVITLGTPNLAYVIDNIQPMIDGGNNFATAAIELQGFYYLYNPNNVGATYPRYTAPGLYWSAATVGTGSSTGSFKIGSYPGTAQRLGQFATAGSGEAYIAAGSLVQLTNAFNVTTWTSVVSVVGDGTGNNNTGLLSTNIGAVTITGVPDTGSYVTSICAPFVTTFTTAEQNSIAAAMDSKQTFGIGYDQLSQTWYVINNTNLSPNPTFNLTYAQNTTGTNKDASWLLKVIYNTNSWIVQSRAQRYIFESVDEVRFFYSNSSKTIDQTTGKPQYDYVSVLGVNSAPLPPAPAPALGQDYLWQIYGQEVYPDGYADPASVRVTFWSDVNTPLPDNPDEFTIIVNPDVTPPVKYVFFVRYTDSEGYQYYQPINIAYNRIYSTPSAVPQPPNGNWKEGEVAYVISTGAFLQYTAGSLVDVTADYKVRIGRNNISYLWKHYATYEQRIDPAIMNIIDIFILTTTYDTNLRNWISTGGSVATEPLPPTTQELNSAFAYFEQYKMMTDQIVWHPVTYKLLFGSQAQPEYQVLFKVVKVPGTSYSDNEVRSLVKNQIDLYFSLTNWDFGQSFFFTEMASYIQMNLATIVATIVMVPTNGTAKFGDLFEIIANPDEIFISCATVQNIVIVSSLTEAQLGITNG
jgi:hypothetical protein